jgi:hypothetical protein
LLAYVSQPGKGRLRPIHDGAPAMPLVFPAGLGQARNAGLGPANQHKAGSGGYSEQCGGVIS